MAEECSLVCSLCGWYITVATSHGVNQHGALHRADLLWQTRFRFLSDAGLSSVSVLCLGSQTPGVAVNYGETDDSQRDHDPITTGYAAVVHGIHRPFHDACWALLTEYMGQKELQNSQGALAHILESLPKSYPDCHIIWGHSYGGLHTRSDQKFYPWDEGRFRGVPNLPSANDDPTWTMEQLNALAQSNRTSARADTPHKSFEPIKPRPDDAKDFFWRLPHEIRENMTFHMPTEDFAALRLSSDAFWQFFYSPSFWASRFKPGFERSWVPESQRRNMPHEWRRMFSVCQGVRENRARIWDKIYPIIAQIANLEWVGTEGENVEPPREGATSMLNSYIARAQIQGPGHFAFDRGCKVFRQQYVPLGKQRIHSVECSFFRLGDASYICGLSIITSAGEMIKMGYETPDRASTDTAGLRGFVLAINSRGVQALKAVGVWGTESTWLGEPDDSPKTRRCVTDNLITGLHCGFDGCKMVFMHIPHNGLPREQNTLRTNDLWWPDVPDSHFSISESVHGYSNRLLGYRPLIQIPLGGPTGRNLFDIIRVTVRFCSYGLQSIRFGYQDSCKQLDAVLGLEDDNDAEVHAMEWNINDNGNEFITQFEVFTRQLGEDLQDELYTDMGSPDSIAATPHLQQHRGSVPLDEPCTRALMLYTNRKRFLFSPYGSVVPKRSRKRRVNFQGFEIITGFYGAQGPLWADGHGIRLLGCLGSDLHWLSRHRFENPANPESGWYPDKSPNNRNDTQGGNNSSWGQASSSRDESAGYCHTM